MSTAITPFRVNVPQSDLDDLKLRLSRTRWPEHETVNDWSQGVPLKDAQALVEYWSTQYDWRRCEAALNQYEQFTTEIDGLSIHFLHVRSKHANARPMLLTHGWPGAILEFMNVIEPLTNPTAHGATADDAFHLVIPTLPGFGFSGRPSAKGWSIPKIAGAWAELMKRLGYSEYLAQGGDWGAAVTTALGAFRPAGLQAIHVNMPLVMPRNPGTDLSPDEAAMLAKMHEYAEWDSGYSHQQSTRPQTLGYGLADSPAGQAMWIFEKFWRWTDCDGDPQNALSYDQILDVITLYWLTNSGASSGRLYWESYKNGFFAVPLELPVGCSIFPKEIYRAPRTWADKCMSQIVYWGEPAKGGHFAAFEQPALFVGEVRSWARCVPR
ncbi:pimeloyl-ACP methyl ester carboxylesterase [Panacagrimonas perspica]|uniref:Pimeloyl-ACP methyl ester carboxylesterase n=1 Tax=Panacagrimonas perspica TaxID=381431 RepID=A0A4V3URU8_9GAMM|nr:epoxide hydrolase family protein [Panacagrimonas perspica]TDU31909.1 pimeloyl-ACP methyl ester carboxylesterase [Panacagrimonas perspica]THD04231.1 epoxide hydrolase [Panacagrimonas perspica]